MFSFHTEYPIWLLIFCLAAGILYAWILYRRDAKFSELPILIRWILPTLRFILITLIAFFLLSPVLRHVVRTVERPILIIAQDNSSSLVSIADSGWYRSEYPSAMKEMIGVLAEKFDTATYSFGDKVVAGIDFSFSNKQTDYSELFREIESRYSNRNVGAVILASDGLYNRGKNPVYQEAASRYPVYTLALGDSAQHKDLILSGVLHNRMAYLNNQFPVEVQIRAQHLQGGQTVCSITRNGKELYTKLIMIDRDDFMINLPVMLQAEETGIQRYSIRLSAVEGENSKLNNARDIFIDVMDGREKILLLADAPHPDIAAIKSSLENNENYEVESKLISDFSGDLKSYSLVILHQVPSAKTASTTVLNQVVRSETPLLLILGTELSAAAFNSLQLGLTVNGQAGKQTDAHPIVSEEFSLFALSDELKSFIPSLPPLQCQFGDHKVNVPASILFRQRIGMVETQQPLVMFTQGGDRKSGIVAGEGFWRWKMTDMAEHGQTDLFNELILKTVQYLSVRADKSFFRVYCKNSFLENEAVAFEAELYNESYELVNTPDVSIELINEEGRKYPFTFSKTDKAYRLHAGLLPPGNYRYSAKTSLGEKVYTEKGEFTIIPLQVESVNTVADHKLLFDLSSKSGGQMYTVSGIKDLLENLLSSDSITSVSRSENRLSDLVNLKWLFFLLLGLVTTEWVIRKMNGSY